MILSVSRRTDIPAFYMPWFMNRLREGYVMVRNPMNYHQVSRVSLSPEVIDCIVFWTKNAMPLTPHLGEIALQYPFYIQYTLNPYGRDLEPGLPPLAQRLASACAIAEQFGSKHVVWRYDPIMLTEQYTADWHIEQFAAMADALKGSARECVFSFVDLYDKVQANLRGLGVRICSDGEMDRIAAAFAAIARENGFRLRTCAEKVDLQRYGIAHGCCVDGDLIAELIGWTMAAKKDPNQRPECGCLESIDIGQYNTCRHGCRYCYATFNAKTVETLSARHDPASPFLIGQAEPGDKVTERKMKSRKKTPSGQISFF